MPLGGWRSAALPAAVVLLALSVNHDAYRGYFEDDDLATLSWEPMVPLMAHIRDIPLLDYKSTSRPVGFLYFGVIMRHWGLTYPPYLAVLQILGTLNIVLLWFVLRRLGLEPLSCAAGCLFFALHRALFDGWWKPMFVYDVSCTTFALLSILAYASRRWVLSFIAFWLAIRAKEIGITVPAILLCYEMSLGEKKWLRTIPFFLPALILGGFGLAFNLRQQSLYAFRFTIPALWKAAAFYASKLLWIPYAGFFFLLLPAAIRDRRLYFGIAAMLLGLAIYLLLSEKMYEIYLYLAMTGAAIVVAVLARERPALCWTLLTVWAIWQIQLTRVHAAETLAAAGDRRAFVSAARSVPDSHVYIYDHVPASMHSWGVEATMNLTHPGEPKSYWLTRLEIPTKGPMLLLNWKERTRQLSATPFAPLASVQVSMDQPVQEWQLVAGWQPAVDGYREIGRRATANLYRPPNINDFVWEACATGPAELRTFIEGIEFPRMNLKETECVHGQGRMPPDAARIVTLDFLAEPRSTESRVRIRSFGFCTKSCGT
jgi:hypothetical protein